MVIESSSTKLPQSAPLNLQAAGIVVIGISLVSFTIYTITIVTKPTGSFLSPLPSGQLSSNTPTTPTPTLANYATTLNLAQNYLDKAYSLSLISHQTDTDKEQIIENLQQSLLYANQAVSLSPKEATGYLMRSQIFNAISQINPSAKIQSQTDLEVAQKLSNGQSVELPTPVNPLNLLPNQQAAIASNIIIAAPAATTAATQTDISSNSLNGSALLPANHTSITVHNKQVRANSYIYLLPKTSTNNPIFVASKDNGTFTIATNIANTVDTTIDYWIINP